MSLLQTQHAATVYELHYIWLLVIVSP